MLKSNKSPRRKKAHPASSYTVGIDLHSNNMTIGVVDEAGRRIKHCKLPCSLPALCEAIEPFRPALRMIAVESTFNWYWLVDGLRAQGYPVALANPAAIDQYDGIKHAGDKNDAYFLAELLRLDILPTGHIYDPATRPLRDLLRRRTGLVHHRTSLMLSLKSLHHRTLGQPLALRDLKQLDSAQAGALFTHPADCMIAEITRSHIAQLDHSIRQIEKTVLAQVRGTGLFEALQTIPGIGLILGMMIAMETGDISRFASAGNFASYCRTVDSKRTSNGIKKGSNNAKCGNRHLAWAFVEAAQLARQHHDAARRWFDRKAAKRGKVVATKALGCKLAKAAWHIMRTGEPCDQARLFPGWQSEPSRADSGKAVRSQKIGVGENPSRLIGADCLPAKSKPQPKPKRQPTRKRITSRNNAAP